MTTSGPDWVGQEWLHGEIAPWLGAEETLRRTCSVCRAWRHWCNNYLTVLHIGNDHQRLHGSSCSARTAGLSIPLFLPLVPFALRELSMSGGWTSLGGVELGTIRRGCRLKKLVVTGMRFAATLKRLVAVKTRLWNRWDLSTFAALTSLEVSFAGRAMLKQLPRKAEMGSRLAELCVCDLALRNLVRPTELTELAEAVGGASTFRLRRVDVVKEVPNFAYLRAIFGRLQNLQVLELTDVALDDSMLAVLGEAFSSARLPPAAVKGAAAAARAEPYNTFFPSANAVAASQQDGGEGDVAVASLRTLVLGRCGGVSEPAFEAFLDLVAGCGVIRAGLVGKRGSGSEERGGSIRRRRSGGGSDGEDGAAVAAASAGGGLALSSVRLEGCRALGNRGLALLCGGARERLSDIQCPTLRMVKAWGIRLAGSLGGSAVSSSSSSSSPSAEALALRQSFEARGVELAWAGPLPPPSGRVRELQPPRENKPGREQRRRGHGCGVNGGSGERPEPGGGGGWREEGGGGRDGEVGGSGQGRRPCRLQCGAAPKIEDAEDHLEVCPLAPVDCLLRADGCDWKGTRRQRRRHLAACPMWQVMCPGCCRAVHVSGAFVACLSVGGVG
ncbi:conserved unknown protein [Ectocarpus siliculosus]|uniref:TRAF-type domain-containing protein n=1 Tax=Ectocarpus siliculosus TaxID=2880 RepID=D8LM48_ECTSI|nr:conserved unknown protein [Ectocarpus siliculosus]|eukprot:CBN76196.1 conserved unknown protein [Ectocarpus siliculosus]